MSPATMPLDSNSVRCAAKILPVTAPPTTTSRAVMSPTTDAPTPTTMRSARCTDPSMRPSMRSAPSVSMSPCTVTCESSTEKLVLGIGDVSRRLNRLMEPHEGERNPWTIQKRSKQSLKTGQFARSNIRKKRMLVVADCKINKCLNDGVTQGTSKHGYVYVALVSHL